MRYFSGYVLKTSSFAGYTPTAAYWRHTTRNDLPLGGSTSSIYGATGHGMTVNQGNIYVAGYTDWFEFTGEEETSGGSSPQYWVNGTLNDLPGGPRTDFGLGAAYDIRVADGNIAATGIATRDSSYYNSYTSACYWLNGTLYYLVNESDFSNELEIDWYRSNARGIFID